ncbi:hypothetical protein J6Z48_00060 [bacterium]|nr:hypothetical protein [bacterium]
MIYGDGFYTAGYRFGLSKTTEISNKPEILKVIVCMALNSTDATNPRISENKSDNVMYYEGFHDCIMELNRSTNIEHIDPECWEKLSKTEEALRERAYPKLGLNEMFDKWKERNAIIRHQDEAAAKLLTETN